MPRMLHTPGAKALGSKLFIATPTYGPLSSGYTFALFHTGQLLKELGIDCELAIYDGDCHVDDARNRLVRDFLETDCTDLLFIDADLRWQPENVAKIMSYNVDVVGATYPLKQKEEKYPVRLLRHETVDRADGLIEVESVPTGFLRIRREVLQKLYDESIKCKPKSDSRTDIGIIFERQVHDGQRWGGDYVFCKKWGESGKVYLAADMFFDHHGASIWSGRCSTWLKRRSGQTLPGLDDVKAGVDTENTYGELYEEWGNEWAASPNLLCTLAEFARSFGGNILEAGCGLSTLVMASANPNVTVHCMEHNPKEADFLNGLADKYGLTNIEIYVSPLVDGFYSYVPDIEVKLVLSDGPPRAEGDRAKILPYVGDAVLIADDAEEVLPAIEQDMPEREVFFVDKQKRFVVVK